MRAWFLILLLMALAPGAAAGPGDGRPTRKTIRLGALKVEGKLRKPQAFYILKRSNLSFQSLSVRKSFLDKIVESAKHPVF